MKKLKTEKSSENERMLRQVQNHEYLKRDQQVGEMGAPTTSVKRIVYGRGELSLIYRVTSQPCRSLSVHLSTLVPDHHAS